MPDSYDEFLARKANKEVDTAVAKQPDAFDRFLNRENRPDEETDGFVSQVLEKAFKETTVGIGLQAAGVLDEGPGDLGVVGNISAGILGFVGDPATYYAGGLGVIAARQAAKAMAKAIAKKGLTGLAARAVPPAIAAGIQLGGLETARQVVGGELDPGAIVESTIAGATLGPAGLVKNPLLRVGAEVLSMGAVPPLLQGRAPTKDDWINAAGTVGGFKLFNLIKKTLSRKPKAQSNAEAVADATSPKQLAEIESLLAAPTPVETTVPTKIVPLSKGQKQTPEWTTALATKLRAEYPENAAKIAANDKVNVTREDVLITKAPSEIQSLIDSQNKGGRKALRDELKGQENDITQTRIKEVIDPKEAVTDQGQTRTEEGGQAPQGEVVPGVGVKLREAFPKDVQNVFDQLPQEIQERHGIKKVIEAGFREEDSGEGARYRQQIDTLGVERGATPKERQEGVRHEILAAFAWNLNSTGKGNPSPDRAFYEAFRKIRFPKGEVESEGFKGFENADSFARAFIEWTEGKGGPELAKLFNERFPDLAPKKPPTKLEQAIVERDAAIRAVRKAGAGTVFTGIDPQLVGLYGKVLVKEGKVLFRTFGEFVERITQSVGKFFARAHAESIRKAWEDARVKEPKLEPSTDLEPLIDRSTAPEKITRISSPELSRPLAGEPAKDALNVARTVRRDLAGEPDRLTDTVVKAEADKRIAQQGPELRDKMLAGGWVPGDKGIDTKVQQGLLIAQGNRAAATRDIRDIADASRLAMNYDLGGTDLARELRQRSILAEDPGVQQAFFNQRELFKPPEAEKKAISTAQDRERRALSEAPQDVVAPEGFKPPKGEPKPKVEQTPRQKAAAERRKAKTAAKLAEAWAVEVEKIRGKLGELGHDVDLALSGGLDSIKQQEFIRDVHAIKATKGDQFYEWWSNAILSGPATQVVNAVGNVAHAGWHFTAERMTDAIVSSIARSVGLKSGGARFGEFKHIYRAFFDNWGKSAKNFFMTWRSETPQFYLQQGLEAETAFGYRPASIPGKFGKAVRIPWRTLSSVDDFVKSQVNEMERAALAYRQAKSEGRQGRPLQERMNELLDNPNSEVNLRARDTAIRLAFQEKTAFSKNVTSLREDIPGGRYILPFITTPFNIVKTGVRKSPFGSIKLAKEILKASKSGDYSNVQPRVAEQVLAWGATLALLYMNDPADPWITGGNDPNRPFSVKIGGHWWNYGRVEPFATMLGLLIDGINRIHAGDDLFEALKAPFDALLQRVDNQTFFTGISDFMKAARYQDANYVLNWASKFPASWVPNLVRAPIRALADEVPQRRVFGKGALRAENSLKNGLRSFEIMPDHPKFDLWGRPVLKDGSPIPHTDWIWRTLSPVGQRRYVETIGDRLLTRWNAAHPNDRVTFRTPNPYFIEDGKTNFFTDDENATLVRESGLLTQQRVIAAHAAGALDMNNPKRRDIDRLRKIIESSRRRIRNTLKRARRKAAKDAA